MVAFLRLLVAVFALGLLHGTAAFVNNLSSPATKLSAGFPSSTVLNAKGFGAPPKSPNKFDIENIKLEVNSNDPCPCGGATYGTCCEKYLLGRENAPSPEALFKARYTAFALHKPDFIMKTTHPDNPDYTEDTEGWSKGILATARGYAFKGFEVRAAEEADGLSYVVSRSTLVDYSPQQLKKGKGGQKLILSEKGMFKQVDGAWLYMDGAANAEELRQGKNSRTRANDDEDGPVQMSGHPATRRR